MFSYIEKLRGRSDGEKKKFAFLFSFLFVGIIFVVWLTTIYPGFLQQKKINDTVSGLEPSPFSTFANAISQGSSEIGAQISKIKELGASFSAHTTTPAPATSTSTPSSTNLIIIATTTPATTNQ